MGDVALTPNQRSALEALARSDARAWEDRPTWITPAEAGAMVRRGLLKSSRQSERVRGERRVTWMLYAITPAGRQALEATDDQT